MPGFNGAGHEGQGSKTGRGMGKCNPQRPQKNSDESGEQPTSGNGGGKGRGRRMGMGHGRRQ